MSCIGLRGRDKSSTPSTLKSALATQCSALTSRHSANPKTDAGRMATLLATH